MRNWILCSCVALALPCCALGQQPATAGGSATADKSATAGRPTQSAPPKTATAQPKLADLLEAQVREAWASFKNKDKDAYAAFLTDDFQAVESDGDGERSKAKTLREVEHSMYTDFL